MVNNNKSIDWIIMAQRLSSTISPIIESSSIKYQQQYHNWSINNEYHRQLTISQLPIINVTLNINNIIGITDVTVNTGHQSNIINEVNSGQSINQYRDFTVSNLLNQQWMDNQQYFTGSTMDIINITGISTLNTLTAIIDINNNNNRSSMITTISQWMEWITI